MSTQTSERLKLIRESERLKMKEAAELAGINYTTYAGYESGKAMMSLENAKKFLRFRGSENIAIGSCLMRLIPKPDR